MIFLLFFSLFTTIYAEESNVTRHETIFTPQYGIRPIDETKSSYSGAGSTVERTTAIREAIPLLLRDLECKVLIDAPCGDFNWMQHVDLPVETYIGVDVIREIININEKEYANEWRSFVQMDLINQVLPKGDLVLSRDMLIHFSFEDIATFIKLLKESGSKYFLTSHFPDQVSNPDIQTGGWRPINLEKPPFNFPKPILIISEHYTQNPAHADKSLALWEIDDLPCFDPHNY